MLRAHNNLRSAGPVCAGGHPLEVEAGLQIYRGKGNAVDAIVAMAFMGFVVEPIDCGVGGFCRITYRNSGFVHSDGYVRAAGAAHEKMFEVDSSAASTYYGHPPSLRNEAKYGARAIAIPGAVDSLLKIHSEYGALPLRKVMAPAIDQAKSGLPFSWREKLVISSLISEIKAYPDTAAQLLPGGQPPKTPVQFGEGDLFDTRALSKFLEQIANEGREGFYGEKPAKLMSSYIQSLGGIIKAEDFQSYQSKLDKFEGFNYRSDTLSSGGDLISQECLQILENFSEENLSKDPALWRHLFSEALGMSFVDHLNFYGDPEFENSPLDALASRSFAQERAAQIQEIQALSRPIKAGDPWPYSRQARSDWQGSQSAMMGTSQMITADRDGKVASLCTAIGWDFGSLVYQPDLGFFFNNGMSFFDPRPGFANSIKPGKMPSFGAPVLVAEAENVFAAAGSGGYRIQTAVLHAYLASRESSRSLQEALSWPRTHCQGLETFVDSEVSPAELESLRSKGHEIKVLKEDVSTWNWGRVCALNSLGKSGVYEVSGYPEHLTAVGALNP